MKNLWERYLALPQDVRFGIPVILGMMIVIPIAWSWIDRPLTCKQATERYQRLTARESDGSAERFAENTKAIADATKICAKEWEKRGK